MADVLTDAQVKETGEWADALLDPKNWPDIAYDAATTRAHIVMRVPALCRELLTLRSQLATAQAERGWLPIETAPKDERVLVYGTLRGAALHGRDTGKDYGKHVVIASFETEYGFWVDGSQCTPEPTHWMPLPDSPAGDGGRGGDDHA